MSQKENEILAEQILKDISERESLHIPDSEALHGVVLKLESKNDKLQNY